MNCRMPHMRWVGKNSMKKNLKDMKILKKVSEKREAKKKAEISKKIVTQSNLEESREEILAKGKKFKYPFQYAKHRLVVNTIAISVVAMIAFGVVGWFQLYKAQNMGDVIYRFSKILRVPVAEYDGVKVRYSDYLMIYRATINPIERLQGKFDDSVESKQQIAHYKRQALNSAEEYSYALAKLEEAGITISNEEINDALENVKSISGEQRSDEAFEGIVRENFGLNMTDFRRYLMLSIAKKKYSEEFDETAKTLVQRAKKELQNNGGSISAAKDSINDKRILRESQTIFVSTSNLDGGRAAKAAKLTNVNDISDAFVSTNGDGYYIVKLNARNEAGEVKYSSLYIPFSEFNTQMESIRSNPDNIKEYIDVDFKVDEPENTENEQKEEQ